MQYNNSSHNYALCVYEHTVCMCMHNYYAVNNWLELFCLGLA